MDELSGTNVQVVLSIIEGKGFEQVLQSTLINATLNGHSLETDIIERNANPQYATDLVWESDKNALRKMRCGHTPLKVECLTLKDDGTKEKIGYILLSIRSAQIVPRNKADTVRTNWHKLLGLRNDLKPFKPELHLAVTIEDRGNTMLRATTENNATAQDHVFVYSPPTPQLLHAERLIQLGPLNSCHDLFLLNVTATYAENLNILLADKYDIDTKDTFNLWYRILENDVQLKPFKRTFANTWMINEKIVVRIRSSLNILKCYLLKKPHLIVSLKYKDTIVGESEVDLQPLVPTDDIQEFLKCSEGMSMHVNKRCFLCKTNIIQADGSAIAMPYLDLQLRLQYAGAKMDLINQDSNTLLHSKNYSISSTLQNSIENNRNNAEHTKFTELALHRNPAGDFGKCNNTMTCVLDPTNQHKHTHKSSVSCEVLGTQSTNMHCSHSADAVLCSCSNKDYSTSVEAYHCYCLNIYLIAIKLLPSKVSIRNIEFRFHHPKAEIMSTLYPKVPVLSGEKVKLEDIGCKLHFISSKDEIKHLLHSFPPKISIRDAGGDNKSSIAQIVLDVRRLFTQDKPESQYEIPLLDTEQNKIGDIDVALSLKDHGPYYRTKKRTTDENFGPPILDDSLAYKIVDELETWKDRQKEIFKAELKRKEERHLNLLSEEWQKRRENLESKLACSVEQCKMLANSLNNATEDLRTRRMKSLEKEARLIKANEDVQWRYEAKLQEAKDSFRVMQEGLMSKIQILESKKAALESQIEPLVLENEKLQALLSKQTEELEVYQRGSLTQDQTTSLLQELKALEEKLNNAQRSKSFFKEQWGKAVREIHRMKMEHQQAIEVQIKNSKEELKNLDFEEILSADSTALTNDQILLGQIQKEINVIKPVPSIVQRDNYDKAFAPAANISPKAQYIKRNIANKPEEHDERVRALIEERDSLLKTGSYTMDDAVIVKLNKEIQSLLMIN